MFFLKRISLYRLVTPHVLFCSVMGVFVPPYLRTLVKLVVASLLSLWLRNIWLCQYLLSRYNMFVIIIKVDWYTIYVKKINNILPDFQFPVSKTLWSEQLINKSWNPTSKCKAQPSTYIKQNTADWDVPLQSRPLLIKHALGGNIYWNSNGGCDLVFIWRDGGVGGLF